MGYWPKKVKRRRAHWMNNLGSKLVLLGATGEHSIVWPNHPHLSRRIYYIICDLDGCTHYEQGFSEGATLVKMARQVGVS